MDYVDNLITTLAVRLINKSSMAGIEDRCNSPWPPGPYQAGSICEEGRLVTTSSSTRHADIGDMEILRGAKI